MRQIIGFSLWFSAVMLLLYSPILLWATISSPSHHYEIVAGVVIYSIIAIVVSYKIWWTHKEQ